MAKKFPDLTGDGKVTQKDILKGRGVLNTGGKVKKKGMAMGGPMKKNGYAMGGPMKKKGYAMGGPMKKKGYKKGGKVRGTGIAIKGFRPAKMVKMKGS